MFLDKTRSRRKGKKNFLNLKFFKFKLYFFLSSLLIFSIIFCKFNIYEKVRNFFSPELIYFYILIIIGCTRIYFLSYLIYLKNGSINKC
ncbi:hypothetical protein BNATCHR195 (nucleomorph) [Bigelowiella natans]|uniref:Uncharacterized protein n=1 Tax=Bigelowiella natans TaxID=227086 RepID=Q3LWI9_BIGNA|nr:hypothetical protein BNATCHR195 [Bigelowiella natans]ABA27177.1 hypothetical protein [Bigelowiella natans]